MTTCIVCSSTSFATLVTARHVAQEFQLRNQHLADRLSVELAPGQDKDLTDFVHNTIAPILVCTQCGLLVRDEDVADLHEKYRDDPYVPEVMRTLLDGYTESYRKKLDVYAAYLPERPRLLEIGSHVGGCLRAAMMRGWDIEGVDIGTDVAAFANSHGLTTHNTPFETISFGDKTFDGIFILNCFEQMPDPVHALRLCKQLLADHGIVVIRTPNAGLYRFAQSQLSLLRAVGPLSIHDPVVTILAISSLLGFPYLFGFSITNLRQVAELVGLDVVHAESAGQLRVDVTLSPDSPGQQSAAAIEARWASATSALSDLFPCVFLGPWLEVILGKSSGAKKC